MSAPALSVGKGNLPVVIVKHSSGATATVYLHGATLASFKTSAGQELLFQSTRAFFDTAHPIRGGVPVVFPQFGAQGPLPMHGFARTSAWSCDSVGDGHVQLSLSHSDATLALWPHQFKLVTRITFSDEHLLQHLDVINPKGAEQPFNFDALLHTYLFTGDSAAPAIQVGGLGGVTYLDKPTGFSERTQTVDPFTLDREEVDRVYVNTPADVKVSGITSGAHLPPGSRAFTAVVVKRRGAVRQAPPALSNAVMHAPLDVVVWNPGPARAATIADLGADDWLSYVCVEPGRVSTATARALQPNQEFTLTQELVLVHE